MNLGSGKGDEREEVFIKDYGTFTLEQVVESKLIHIDEESRLTHAALLIPNGIPYKQGEEKGINLVEPV